jgi:hypothetical protein
MVVVASQTPLAIDMGPFQPTEFCPVPPYWLEIFVPFQVPEVTVPSFETFETERKEVVALPEVICKLEMVEEAALTSKYPFEMSKRVVEALPKVVNPETFKVPVAVKLAP